VVDSASSGSILDGSLIAGANVTVYPTTSTRMSSAPRRRAARERAGRSRAARRRVAAVRDLLGRVPILGICLGHQLLALATGMKTYKLPFGHVARTIPCSIAPPVACS